MQVLPNLESPSMQKWEYKTLTFTAIGSRGYLMAPEEERWRWATDPVKGLRFNDGLNHMGGQDGVVNVTT